MTDEADSAPIGGEKPQDDNADADIARLKADLAQLKKDLASLLASTAKVASGEARRQAEQAAASSDELNRRAKEYRDQLEETVKSHPLGAVGLSLLAGVLLSSLGRR